MSKENFPVPKNETARQKALNDYDILDTLSEKEYDFITQIASQICNTPVSMITLLDKKRQWIKSNFGIDLRETPREISFCNHTIMNPDKLNIVPDLREDPRYAANPLVTGEPHAVFYAGAPLVTPQGFVLGSICVLDAHAKVLTAEQESALEALARQTMVTLNLRKANKDLSGTEKKLKKANKDLKDFTRVVSHDMKTPLANITMLSKGFKHNFRAKLDANASGYIDLIEQSATELIGFIDRMLIRTEMIGNIVSEKINTKKVDSLAILQKVFSLLALPPDVRINITGIFPLVTIDEVVMQQVFQNLITNAIKYNDKPDAVITIAAESDAHSHYFNIADNGTGIAEKDLAKIFKMKQTLNKTDRYGNKGTGTGLATVKNLLENSRGKISVSSRPGEGTNFLVELAK